MSLVTSCHQLVFGHIAHLTTGAPTHDALHCQAGFLSRPSLGREWRHGPPVVLMGWCWSAPVWIVAANLWQQAVLQGHRTASLRPSPATWRWRIMHIINRCSFSQSTNSKSMHNLALLTIHWSTTGALQHYTYLLLNYHSTLPTATMLKFYSVKCASSFLTAQPAQYRLFSAMKRWIVNEWVDG